jgi:hypothetical protein
VLVDMELRRVEPITMSASKAYLLTVLPHYRHVKFTTEYSNGINTVAKLFQEYWVSGL